MTKTEFVEKVMEKTEMSKKDATKAVEAVLGCIEDALVAGDKVAFTGFGVFQVKERSARTARNPQTGKEIKVPATKAPVFKAGKGLKDAVKG